jgi:PhnB protein
MAAVGIYLNFPRTCEEAFTFYREVFGTQWDGDLMRMSDAPPMPGSPPIAEADRDLVMHVAMPIMNGTMLMGSDLPESMGALVVGNNTTIDLECDTLDEARELYDRLSAGAGDAQPITEQFWGWWGSCLDRYGVRWMFNAPVAAAAGS